MSEGHRRLVLNTQERVMSTDMNRLQKFQHQELAEMMRQFLNVGVSSEDDALGVTNEPTTLGTPLRAEIFGNGFLVKPQAGSFVVLIDGGLLHAIAPDSGSDESNYKYIRDDGVPLPGTLAHTANVSGFTRIDVIECRVNPVEAVVTDSRDIFNATTGLFAAATVTKELRARLEYRVRAGTPNAGMPGNVSGWLPLAVASVPDGAADNDDITYWDVRPLVADRIIVAGRAQPMLRDAMVTMDANTDLLKVIARGTVEVLDRSGRKLGGALRRGTPGTDADTIDLKDVANQSGTLATGGIAYVYLATPFGLPRWARYTDGPAGRVPRAPKGIIVVCDVEPEHLRPIPSSGITMPTSTGLGAGSTTSAVLIAALPIGDLAADDIYQAQISRGLHMHTANDNGPSANVSSIAATSLGAGSLFWWDLVANTHFPRNARALHVHIRVGWAGSGTFTGPTLLVSIDGGVKFVHSQQLMRLTANANNWEQVVRIPVPSDVYPSPTPATLRAMISHGGSLTIPTSAFMTIQGWEF